MCHPSYCKPFLPLKTLLSPKRLLLLERCKCFLHLNNLLSLKRLLSKKFAASKTFAARDDAECITLLSSLENSLKLFLQEHVLFDMFL